MSKIIKEIQDLQDAKKYVKKLKKGDILKINGPSYLIIRGINSHKETDVLFVMSRDVKVEDEKDDTKK